MWNLGAAVAGAGCGAAGEGEAESDEQLLDREDREADERDAAQRKARDELDALMLTAAEKADAVRAYDRASLQVWIKGMCKASNPDDSLGDMRHECLLTQAREFARLTPEASQALGVQAAPVFEEEGQAGRLRIRKRHRLLARLLVVIRRASEEGLRVGEGGEQRRKVRRKDVGDEPGDRLGVQDDVRCEAGGDEVSGQDEIDV